MDTDDRVGTKLLLELLLDAACGSMGFSQWQRALHADVYFDSYSVPNATGTEVMG